MTHTDWPQAARIDGPGSRATGPAVWRRDDLLRQGGWRFALDERMAREIAAAAHAAAARNTPLPDIAAGDCPLPETEPLLADMRHALAHGPGVALLSGLPVETMSRDEAAAGFAVIGAHLGISVSQSHLGDYLGDVTDRRDPADRRPYHNGGEFIMHRDPVDVVGLLCLRAAKRGGESRIVSAGAVHNALLDEAPDVLPLLYEGFPYGRLEADRGGTDLFTPYRLPVFRIGGDGSFQSHYIPGPIERHFAREGRGRDDPAVRAVETFKRMIWEREDLYYDMVLAPGDMQFLNNRLLMHGRTDYEDWDDPARKRHLLRLWLMMPELGPPARDQIFYENTDRAGGGIAWAPQAPGAAGD